MQIKVSKKHLLICLLLCSLFLTSYTSVLNSNGSIYSDENIFDGSSFSSRDNQPSAMSSGDKSGLVDYMSANSSAIYFTSISFQKARLPFSKTNLNILTSLISLQIFYLVWSSRLSNSICPKFDSIQITVFLHKKDGMK